MNSTRTVVVVMPAHNEAEGIAGFLEEIDGALAATGTAADFVVVDDTSTDATAERAEAAAVRGHVLVERNSRNRGHGPSALRAYRAGLANGAPVVVHVDGDGQYLGEAFPALLDALGDGRVAHGIRDGRTDPWFRKALTGMVRVLVAAIARGRVPDVNTPLRAYRADYLRHLLEQVPEDSLVPHVHFSILERREREPVGTTVVLNIPRRGASETGTMWGAQKRPPRVPPRKLVSFARRALGEVVRIRIFGARITQPASTAAD